MRNKQVIHKNSTFDKCKIGGNTQKKIINYTSSNIPFAQVELLSTNKVRMLI